MRIENVASATGLDHSYGCFYALRQVDFRQQAQKRRTVKSGNCFRCQLCIISADRTKPRNVRRVYLYVYICACALLHFVDKACKTCLPQVSAQALSIMCSHAHTLLKLVHNLDTVAHPPCTRMYPGLRINRFQFLTLT